MVSHQVALNIYDGTVKLLTDIYMYIIQALSSVPVVFKFKRVDSVLNNLILFLQLFTVHHTTNQQPGDETSQVLSVH